jgi:hypothetical protein
MGMVYTAVGDADTIGRQLVGFQEKGAGCLRDCKDASSTVYSKEGTPTEPESDTARKELRMR